VLLIATFPREFLTRARLAAPALRVRSNRVLLAKSLVASAAMVALFFAGQPPAKVAIVIGALLLVTRRIKPTRLYAEIDWAMLLMFAGLFILVAGIEKTMLTPHASLELGAMGLGRPAVLATVAAVLSNTVSNVPAVLLLKPFVASLDDARSAWLVLAMGATLAGNLTLLGSVANLIVAERARRHGIRIGFWSYFRVGAPLTVATIALGLWLLR
jgi:Na+/H+ antiporter NhaD/arsenite permease-like protein